MSTLPKTSLSEEEYLSIERAAERKSEYLDGEMFAMSGAAPRHVAIVTNLVRELSTALRGRSCWVFSTDLRLRVSPTRLYTYPDAMVACGELRFADDRKDTLLNPSVVVEVLSESTQDWDRGGKFAHYRTLDSVTDYLLVAQDRHHVEMFSRRDDGRWLFWETDRDEDRIDLPSVGASLRVGDLYEGVDALPA
jgi:Uma2 family endonuclease